MSVVFHSVSHVRIPPNYCVTMGEGGAVSLEAIYRQAGDLQM